jgi:DNA-binding transcriptional LysR family regulator
LIDTDLVAIMPAHPAALFSKDGKLRIGALAMATPTFNVNLYWHERFYRDPALRWLIAQISDPFACSDNALPFEQPAPLEPRVL